MPYLNSSPTASFLPQSAPNETEVIHEVAHPAPYDESLLEKARTQWQFGDWEGLTKLDRETLQHHPDRAKLVLFAAAGFLQQGDILTARQCIRLAQEWRCNQKLISQILIAGVYNSFGRAAALSGQWPRALKQFGCSIAIGTPGGEMRLITQARSREQLGQLGLQNQIEPFGFQENMGQISASENNRPNDTIDSIAEENKGKYCLDFSYKSRSEYFHYDDLEETDNWQLEVYLHVYALMKKHGYNTVADIGCGSAYKLVTYLGGFHTIGYELPANVKILKERHPNRDWRVSDLDSEEVIDVDIIVCSDVIEHLVDPDSLIRFLLKQKFKYLVLSTPERELVYSEDDPRRLGPPGNLAHQREWNFQEFAAYIGRSFKVLKHLVTNIKQATQMIICVSK